MVADRLPPRLRAGLESPGHRYGLLLAVILLSLAFQLATEDGDVARFVTILLQGLTLQLALRLSGAHRWVTDAATVVIAATVVVSGIALLGVGGIGTAPVRVTTLLLILLAPAAIAVGVVRELRTSGRVSLHTMFGVLCIYLLIGVVFAFAFGVVESLQNRPFFTQPGTDTTSNFLYFSFTTITTTGYGDLTPGTDLGRSLAITEALLGQIYLVTIVALIVSNLGRPRET